MPDPQTIPLTVTTSDPMLAAMLRLVAAQGLAIEADAIERPAPDEPERLLLSVVLVQDAAPAVTFDHDDDEAIDPHADERRPAGSGVEVDLLPPDDDAVYRPSRRGGDADTDKRGEIDIQLAIVSRLADNPRLADVARHLLKPLAGRGYRIDGNHEAALTRLANEFATHPPRQLAKAAALLLEGRHECVPDQGEIYQALGRASKPGSPVDQQKAA